MDHDQQVREVHRHNREQVRHKGEHYYEKGFVSLGSARKEHDVQLNSSGNFSAARQRVKLKHISMMRRWSSSSRRHSNSSQRSLPLTSPRPDLKQVESLIDLCCLLTSVVEFIECIQCSQSTTSF